jgi:hypothetical protein
MTFREGSIMPVADRACRFSFGSAQNFTQAWVVRRFFLRRPANFDLHGLGVFVASLELP